MSKKKKSSKKDKIDQKSPYVDPPQKNKIIEEVKKAENHDEIIKIINRVFPTWILGWPKSYSNDYPHFQNNWEYVCKKTNSKTLSVIIVDQITFNHPKFSLLQLFAELLTVFGHSVRRKEEFIECNKCRCAIPTIKVYNQLVERKIQSPSKWMNHCTKCV
jgi:hypothetical protein